MAGSSRDASQARPGRVSEGIATPGQVTAALASLRQFTDDPGTLIWTPG
jgi:hypothetical protein